LHIKGLARVNGPTYSAVVELLNSLAAVKAFILLAMLDLDATVAAFEFFFGVLLHEHFESKAAESMVCDGWIQQFGDANVHHSST
jgi:hypothetical protein